MNTEPLNCNRKARKVNTGQSNLTKKAASPPHIDGSVVFVRWRQCAPHLTHACLHPPESIPQTASQSGQPFLHSSRQKGTVVYNGPSLLLEIASCMGGSGHHQIHNSLGPPESATKRHLDRFGCFCRAHNHDRPTDRPCYSVCNKRPHLRSTAVRPKKWKLHITVMNDQQETAIAL